MTRPIMTAFVACGLSAMPCYAQTIGQYTIGVGANVVQIVEADDVPDISGCTVREVVNDDGSVTRIVEC